MAIKKTSIKYLDFSGGLNSGTSDFLLKDNELSAMKNVWSYKTGTLEKVPGYLSYGDYSLEVLTGTVRHLLNHFIQSGTPSHETLIAIADDGDGLEAYFFKIDNSDNKWRDAGISSVAWTDSAGWIPSSANFLEKVFLVGYDPDASTAFLTNVTIGATGTPKIAATDSDLTDMPLGRYIVKYRDLIYVLHAKVATTTYPTRAYYCSSPVAGAITWTPTTDFIEIGNSDNEVITGAVVALDKLIIFKDNSMWSYDEYQIKKIANVGCADHRSIQLIGNKIYWYNRSGVWMWSGGEPVLVSQKIQKHIDSITATNSNNAISSQFRDMEYHLNIGDVTVNGITYENAFYCYDTTRNTWYLKSYPDNCTTSIEHKPDVFSLANKKRLFFAGDGGTVFYIGNKTDNLYTFNGEEISSFFTTKSLDHGKPEDSKFTGYLTVFSENQSLLKLAVDVDKNNSFDEYNLVKIDKNISGSNIGIQGRRFNYKFYEQSSAKPFVFEGFVVETNIDETNE